MQRNIRKKISTYKENLNYREAKYDEIDKINHIIKYGYHIKWDKDFFYKMIDNGTYILNIIKLEDEIIGFIAIQKIKDECDIIMLIIDQKHRGKGYSKFLLAETLNYLKSYGIKKIFLDVAATNHSAINLYEKFGFKKFSERLAYYKYDDLEIDAISYRLVNN